MVPLHQAVEPARPLVSWSRTESLNPRPRRGSAAYFPTLLGFPLTAFLVVGRRLSEFPTQQTTPNTFSKAK